MPQTKKIIAAAAVAVGILIGGYLWINNAQKADKQAAIDTFNAFSEAMLELDIPKAQSMARGEAHASLLLLAQLLDKSVNIKVEPSEKPPVHEFIYADGELRVLSDGGENLTVLRKTDGKWYVEDLPSTISKTMIPEILELISK
ncbi:MAG: hypothetical protein OXT69_14730 [Candidatus Poribacteria bacterium]|nr:hypothetical protein [Candidatus Poribacteria bacterium]